MNSSRSYSRPPGFTTKRREALLAGCVAAAALFAGAAHGVAQTQTPMSAERQAAFAQLTGKLRVGAEFFLNRSETKETVEKHFKLMGENGLTVVRIFVIWDDIERTPGNWDLSHYDWIYDAAAKNGIKIAATLCTEDPPGWTDKTTFYHQRANLDDPDLRAHAEIYLEKVVGRYRNHPAQGPWLLMNEPTKYHQDADTFRAFGGWLQKKYGTVDELNKHWFRPVKSFADVKVDANQFTNGWVDEEMYLDWKEFNVDNLIDTLIWIQDKVLALDPNHPTHFNVTRPTGDSVGQDVWKEDKIPDFIGVSMHWTSLATTADSDYGELYAYRLDLVGDASKSEPARPFWVTELQSGPTMYTGRFPFSVTPQILTRWMWDTYGAGAKAVVFWLWHPRDIGHEAGEWGLVGLDGTPSVRLPAVKAIADALNSNPSLASSHPQPARVAILFNREAALVNELDGRAEDRSADVTDALTGCYLALLRAHIPAQFVDIDQLKRGEVNKFAVLYAPFSYALDDAGVAALKEYVSQGGTLWADGLTAWKDETGRVRPSVPGGLTDVFGVKATDIYTLKLNAPYSVTAENELGGELWKLPLVVKDAEVVLRDGDGNPFFVKNGYGKGRVYYYASALTLAYKLRNNPEVQQWIIEPALKQAAEMPVQLKQGSDRVIFRGLVGATGATAILTNWGDAQTAQVSFRGTHKVKNALTGEAVLVTTDQGNTLATVPLAAGASAVLIAE